MSGCIGLVILIILGAYYPAIWVIIGVIMALALISHWIENNS